MAAEVQPIQQAKLPSRPSSLTPEQTYWRTFKSPLNLPSPSSHSVTHITQPTLSSSQPVPPAIPYFAVTTGARIQLFSTKTRKLVKAVTRFSDTAYSGAIRPVDSRVLAAADETGTLQVFDISSRAILKTWKEHKQPVRNVSWHPSEPTTLMSTGDDTTVRLWDLPSDNSTSILRGHTDYVRTGTFMPTNSPSSILIASASYDTTVRLWDPRAPTQSANVMTFSHASPVESLLPLPSGTQLATASGNQLAIIDLVAGKPLHTLKPHQKAITSLCLASNNSRLVTGGLDGHMKVLETTAYNVVAGSKYPSPILSLCVVSGAAQDGGTMREDKHVVVGTSSGMLHIKTRLSGDQKAQERERQREMEALIAGKIEQYDKARAKKRGRGWEKRFRGRDFTGEGADIIIEANDGGKKKKLKEWEKALHKTRYAEALDTVLAGKDKMTVFTILTELRYRSALRAALSNRSIEELKPVMDWVYHNVKETSLAKICVEVSMIMMDLYSGRLSDNEEGRELEDRVKKLHRRVREEVERCMQAKQTMGMLELVAPGLGS